MLYLDVWRGQGRGKSDTLPTPSPVEHTFGRAARSPQNPDPEILLTKKYLPAAGNMLS